MIVTITHYIFNLIITKYDSTQKFMNKVDELRAVSSHMLGATGVYVLKDDLDHLKLTRGEDGVVISHSHGIPTLALQTEGCDLLGKCDAITVDMNGIDLLRQAIGSSPGRNDGTTRPALHIVVIMVKESTFVDQVVTVVVDIEEDCTKNGGCSSKMVCDDS
ncbi:hypothetical protein Tco_0631781 [Tanacetum coccineum]